MYRNSILFINVLAFLFGLSLMIKNQGVLFISRIGQGICAGLFSSTIPIIINEFSPQELFSIMGTMHQMSIAFGIFFSFLFAFIVDLIFVDPLTYWFIIFGFTLPIILIQSIILFKVFPFETPAYLISKGRD